MKSKVLFDFLISQVNPLYYKSFTWKEAMIYNRTTAKGDFSFYYKAPNFYHPVLSTMIHDEGVIVPILTYAS